MSSSGQEDEITPGSEQVQPTQPQRSLPERGTRDDGQLPSWRTWALVIVAGVGAGVLSSLATEVVLKAYASQLRPPMKPMPTMEDARQILLARVASGTGIYGLMGGILGLALGLVGGTASRSARAAILAGAMGLV